MICCSHARWIVIKILLDRWLVEISIFTLVWIKLTLNFFTWKKCTNLCGSLVGFRYFSWLNIILTRWSNEIWCSSVENYGDQKLSDKHLIFYLEKEILTFNANFCFSIFNLATRFSKPIILRCYGNDFAFNSRYRW